MGHTGAPTKGITVLSLFDGISCGQLALQKAGIAVSRYFASEIDKPAIAVALKNFPHTVQLGDVTSLSGSDLPKIDLLIGGSPCQGFSNAGLGMNFYDSRSRLFWAFKRLLDECKPKYFLLENVVMKKEWQDIISRTLGVKPIQIDSSLTSAAVRKRLYWTNIPNVRQPADCGVAFRDIREYGHPKDNMYYSAKALRWIRNHEERSGKTLRIYSPKDNGKMQMLESTMYKKYSSQRFFGVLDTFGLRYITPLECERCMNLPDGYTEGISNTARYKVLGNAWEVHAVSHILKNCIF